MVPPYQSEVEGRLRECTFPRLDATLAQQYYITLLMRAGVQEVGLEEKAQSIAVICSHMEPVYVEAHLAAKKYKKVSKNARARLLICIEKGWSIVNVSKMFGINYSTAKSIVQNNKKRILKAEPRTCSTESVASQDDSLLL